MSPFIWIKNVFYFSRKLLWACITFNKEDVVDYWVWLKGYFDREQLVRCKKNSRKVNN